MLVSKRISLGRNRYETYLRQNQIRSCSGKTDLAREDFEKAASLNYGLDVADVNLAKLGTVESGHPLQGS